MNTNDTPMTDARLLQIDPQDNVLIALAAFAAGATVRIGGQPVLLSRPLPFGHKVAARDIRSGEKIIKYVVSIGSATRAIARGDHVHTHNLKSDYLPTYLHADQERYFKHET
jgi:altronate dehydratase small subunit